MPASWARLEVVRYRYPLIDSFGTFVVDYDSEPEVLTVPGCWVEPLESTVDDNGQVLTVTAYRIAAPFTADILARDKVSHPLASGEWVVVGDPQRVVSPTGALNQLLITVRRWDRGGQDAS